MKKSKFIVKSTVVKVEEKILSEGHLQDQFKTMFPYMRRIFSKNQNN